MLPTTYELWPGVPYPLGASYDGNGTNFAVYSANAEAIELIIFDPAYPDEAMVTLRLSDVTNHVFHGYVLNVRPGALYGFRAHGRFAPKEGLRFNPKKLLVDPYARAFLGKPDWNYPLADGDVPSPIDTAPGVPRCVVVDRRFDWKGEVRPQIFWRRAVIYELHVKSMTALHPKVPEPLRGTYAGLAHPAVIEHLLKLGVTSVELLPVQECSPEGFLLERGLTNYWGYSTLGYFAPDQRFAASRERGGQVAEFKAMVKSFHQAGIEVLLDVVLNHTCEGDHRGPTLCFRGLDNSSYYWLDPNDPSRYLDFSGCGNALKLDAAPGFKLALDSLRYWVEDMHVDGFRFDLATTLGRVGHGGFSRNSPFFLAITQDPVLSRVKLIAEPWDTGPEGYRTGNFPNHFAEWNDKYRMTVRKFWRGDLGQVAQLGYRLTGSSDLFKLSGRRPADSINYITSHDGFTLRDLVSYAYKHNLANLENNRDGATENHSSNWGVEGETDDPVVLAERDQAARNMMATLFLSVGTPMLNMGDEMGRTQHGNNNGYCQDNELSYVNWSPDERGREFLKFVQRCANLRKNEQTLRRRYFFVGSTIEDSRSRDVVWFHPEGRELTRVDWENPELLSFGMLLGGDALRLRGPQAEHVVGTTLLLYMNASEEPVQVRFPERSFGSRWELILDTGDMPETRYEVSSGVRALPARALSLWRHATSASGILHT